MKTRQIFPRPARLALTITIGALCLCARSQNVTLSIAPAVQVTWTTTTNKAYQVETSADVSGNYVPAGGLIEGTGGMVGGFFGGANPAPFFRILGTKANGIN